MASINKVILIGNLGRDPEVKYAPSGMAVCNVSIATTRGWKDKNTGDKVEETEWHRIVFYDRLAEIAGEYLKKGKPVYIEGRLKTRKWQDKDGKDVYTTEVVAEQMQLLGGRDSGGDEAPAQQRQQAPAQRQAAPTQQRQAPVPKTSGGGGSTGTAFDDLDDDIPFVSANAEHDPMLNDSKGRRTRRAR